MHLSLPDWTAEILSGLTSRQTQRLNGSRDSDRGVSLGCYFEIPNPRSGILWSLIQRVSVKTDQTGREIELVGEITERVRLASELDFFGKEPYRSSVKVVAGVGFESTTFRVMSLTSKSATYVQPAIDCLGEPHHIILIFLVLLASPPPFPRGEKETYSAASTCRLRFALLAPRARTGLRNAPV